MNEVSCDVHFGFVEQVGAVPWNLDHPDFFDDFLTDLPEPRAGISALVFCAVLCLESV